MSLGPSIFWTTIFATFLILFVSTLAGRPMARFFSDGDRDDIRFYLAPAFGLALLLIFVAVWGRYVPFGDSILFAVLITGLLTAAIALEADRRGALIHAALAGSVGVATSASLLGALWHFGALNPHNDTFTYLAQSDWLQTNAFSDWIIDRTVTPASTQVSLYQYQGFRMGGTYLLGLFQSVLNIRWAFDIYPSVVAASAGASALAVGLPAATALKTIPLLARLAGLTVVGNGLGGVSFAAHYGFMPQGYGILFGAACLFAYGRQLPQIASGGLTLAASAGAAFPIALLTAASIFSYSEIAPFIVTAAGLATLVVMIRGRTILPFMQYGLFLGLFTGLCLNREIIRSIRALKVQAGAVVGSPIDWHFLGYIGHAVGLHGGGWDVGQWTLGGALGKEDAGLVIALVTILILALAGARSLLRTNEGRALAPTVLIVLLFSAGLVYFRYVAHNPFPIGTGQSWSQFKLANWSHIFVLALLFASILPLAARVRLGTPLVVMVAGLSLYTGLKIGYTRTLTLKSFYIGEQDLSARLKAIRAEVLEVCRDNPSIYLDLSGNDHKFRQLLALYLADRTVKADWVGDGYIEGQLPEALRSAPLGATDCLVEPRSMAQGGRGKLQGQALIRSGIGATGEYRIDRIENDHDRESDGSSWWLWAGRQVRISVSPRLLLPDTRGVDLRFWIGSERAKDVTVTVIDKTGATEEIAFHLENGAIEKTLPLATRPDAVAAISFKTSAEPEPIGKGDPRKASFLLKNFTLTAR